LRKLWFVWYLECDLYKSFLFCLRDKPSFPGSFAVVLRSGKERNLHGLFSLPLVHSFVPHEGLSLGLKVNNSFITALSSQAMEKVAKTQKLSNFHKL
jgi:hypothetical protein